MKYRFIFSLIIFVFVFLGVLSLVGSVHVAEFYGILALSVIAFILAWWTFPIIAKEVNKFPD